MRRAGFFPIKLSEDTEFPARSGRTKAGAFFFSEARQRFCPKMKRNRRINRVFRVLKPFHKRDIFSTLPLAIVECRIRCFLFLAMTRIAWKSLSERDGIEVVIKSVGVSTRIASNILHHLFEGCFVNKFNTV